MLGRRRRRWATINPTLVSCLVFAGIGSSGNPLRLTSWIIYSQWVIPSIPFRADTRGRPRDGPMRAQRLRRWARIGPSLGEMYSPPREAAPPSCLPAPSCLLRSSYMYPLLTLRHKCYGRQWKLMHIRSGNFPAEGRKMVLSFR